MIAIHIDIPELDGSSTANNIAMAAWNLANTAKPIQETGEILPQLDRVTVAVLLAVAERINLMSV